MIRCPYNEGKSIYGIAAALHVVTRRNFKKTWNQ